MDQQKIEKELRFLKIYAGVTTLVCAVVFLSAFSASKNAKFDEIEVGRINVVEKDGKLKMVISNRERQHPGVIDGKVFDRKGLRPAGMIFFSEKGDEIGGLVFDGNTGKGQGGSLTFDKFRGDQTIQLTHSEDTDGSYFAGLRVNDQNTPLLDFISKMEAIEKLPTKEARDAAQKELRDKELFPVNRLLIGKSRDKASIIELKDAKGKARIEISVAASGNPKLNFLDENGKVIYSLPEDAKAKK
jgi:hypothetical protein